MSSALGHDLHLVPLRKEDLNFLFFKKKTGQFANIIHNLQARL